MPKPHMIAILAYDGLCTFEYGCAVEVFGLSRPEMGADWYQCMIIAAEKGPLCGLGGVSVEADGGLELLSTATTIIVPGWRGPTAPVPQALAEALRGAHVRGSRLVGICAGAFVLAAAGVLQGRRATTHWYHVDRLAAASPGTDVVDDVLYVDEGSVLTSAGSAAGLDLCLHLVRKDYGAKAANQIARRLVLSTHREGGQAQFIDRPVPVRAGSRIGPFLDDVRSRLAEPWSVERMAASSGMSVRGIHRHMQDATGLSPGAWLLSERLKRARILLEETTPPIDVVARDAGLGSAMNLRRHLQRTVGLAPKVYRARFDATA